MLPFAGKEQSYLGPQFQVYQSSLRPDLERAQNRLKEAREGLPKFGPETFKTQTGTLMFNLASAHIAAHEVSVAQIQIAMFADMLAKDLRQQAAAGFGPAQPKEPITVVYDRAVEVSECARESKARADVLLSALRQTSDPKAGAAGLIRSTKDLQDMFRGQDLTSRCMTIAATLHDQVGSAVLLHDSNVANFNARAERDAGLLKLLTGIGAALLFVYGRPALKTLQGVLRSFREKRK